MYVDVCAFMWVYQSTTGRVTLGRHACCAPGKLRTGSWCWAASWMQIFAEAGFPCFAMSLRGTSWTPQAEGVQSVQLSEHVADLVGSGSK